MISGILNVINVVRHYILGDGEVFPRHQYVTTDIVLNYFASLSRNELITNQLTSNPIASLICEIKSNYLIIDQPTTTTHRCFCAGDTINMILPSRLLF